jgi:heme-degrading monooxygenase HmoA
MHARMVTVQFKPGTIEEGVKIYRDSIVPEAKKQAGFDGCLLLADRTTAKGISITMWGMEGQLLASEQSGYYGAQLAKLTPLLASEPVREIWEGTIHELRGSMKDTSCARLLFTHFDPAKINEGVRITRDSVLPVARQQKGFEGFVLLIDSPKSRGLSVTCWESLKDLQANETSGYLREQLGKITPLMTEPPVKEVYEIVVQVQSAGTATG